MPESLPAPAVAAPPAPENPEAFRSSEVRDPREPMERWCNPVRRRRLFLPALAAVGLEYCQTHEAVFEALGANPVWRGRLLKTLLKHSGLANYNRELVNWKLDEAMYRDYVLSALVEPAADGDTNWRRRLWENFYPRIRKEQSPEAAAEIVVRFLRERVTISGVARGLVPSSKSGSSSSPRLKVSRPRMSPCCGRPGSWPTWTHTGGLNSGTALGGARRPGRHGKR